MNYKDRIDTLTLIALWITAWLVYRQFAAAKRSADAAKEGLVLTKLALRITERAYLEIDDWAVIEQNDGRKISFRVVNAGRTPAHDLRVILNWAHDVLPSIPNYREGKLIPSVHIVAKTPYSVVTDFPALDQLQHDAFNAGMLRVLFYGSVTYKDQFGIRLHIRRFAVDMGLPNWRWSDSGYNDEFDEG